MANESVVESMQTPAFNHLIRGVSDSSRRKSIGPKRETLNEEELQEAEGVARAAGLAMASAVMGFELITKFLYMADEHEDGNIDIVNVAELVGLLGQVVDGADRVSGDAAYVLQRHYMLKAGEAA